jgi:hypothetical protein
MERYNTNTKVANFGDYCNNFEKEKEDLKKVKRSINPNTPDTQKYPKNSKFKFNNITRKMDDLTPDIIDDTLKSMEEETNEELGGGFNLSTVKGAWNKLMGRDTDEYKITKSLIDMIKSNTEKFIHRNDLDSIKYQKATQENPEAILSVELNTDKTSHPHTGIENNPEYKLKNFIKLVVKTEDGGEGDDRFEIEIISEGERLDVEISSSNIEKIWNELMKSKNELLSTQKMNIDSSHPYSKFKSKLGIRESKIKSFNESSTDLEVLSKLKQLPAYGKLKEDFKKSIREFTNEVNSSAADTGYDEGDTDHDMAFHAAIQEVIDELVGW